MLLLPMPRAICASRYISSTVAVGEVRNPTLPAPWLRARFLQALCRRRQRHFPIDRLQLRR